MAEFMGRRAAGEALTQQAFALEKGISVSQLKHWLFNMRKGHTPGPANMRKRDRAPKYWRIEDEVRLWMAGHGDQAKIPVEEIRRKALEIARRLGINDFKASNSWITGLKERYQQVGQRSSRRGMSICTIHRMSIGRFRVSLSSPSCLLLLLSLLLLLLLLWTPTA